MARQMNSQVDPDARRQTPLAAKLKQRIAAEGPISVEAYVDACLYDPEHGYYVSKPAIGEASDFVTAPEISQVFGELIGIWTILTWQQVGMPSRLNLAELGPGRGTMMADALRSIAKVPQLAGALDVHLVDTNQVLRETQKQTLANSQAPLHHHGSPEALAKALGNTTAPSIILANEFVDALGVRQQTACGGYWRERLVDIGEDDQLVFSVDQQIAKAESADAAEGAIRETNPAIERVIKPLLTTIASTAPMAALFIDYGYDEPAHGETLQAMRAHAYEHPLTSPGEADLTAHVDFAELTASLASAGLSIDGPIAQAEFLGRLGIVERTSQLMARNPDKAAALEAATMRLLAPNGMGTRFKALGARNWAAAPLTGFANVA